MPENKKLYIGSTAAKYIYKGNTEVQSVYLGNQLIYEKASNPVLALADYISLTSGDVAPTIDANGLYRPSEDSQKLLIENFTDLFLQVGASVKISFILDSVEQDDSARTIPTLLGPRAHRRRRTYSGVGTIEGYPSISATSIVMPGQDGTMSYSYDLQPNTEYYILAQCNWIDPDVAGTNSIALYSAEGEQLAVKNSSSSTRCWDSYYLHQKSGYLGFWHSGTYTTTSSGSSTINGYIYRLDGVIDLTKSYIQQPDQDPVYFATIT